MKLTKTEKLMEKELIKRTKGMKPEEAVAYIVEFCTKLIIWKEIKEQIHGLDGCNGSKSKKAISHSKKICECMKFELEASH